MKKATLAMSAAGIMSVMGSAAGFMKQAAVDVGRSAHEMIQALDDLRLVVPRKDRFTGIVKSRGLSLALRIRKDQVARTHRYLRGRYAGPFGSPAKPNLRSHFHVRETV